MKLSFPINTNTVSVLVCAVTLVCFFVGAISDVLHDPFFLILLVTLTSGITITMLVVLAQRAIKKNRLKEIPKDDLA